MARALVARGYEVVGHAEAEVYIVNTCTVTATADAKARKLIRKLAREHPGAALIVTGCLAQRDAAAVAALPGVTAVLPNTRKGEVAEVVARVEESRSRGVEESNTRRGEESRSRGVEGTRVRAFVKVQDGCDHGCAYCAVPGARGAMVSKPREEVRRELARLAEARVQEVVLCGIRLGAYDGFAGLLCELRAVDIARVRLSSLEPMDVEEALLAEIADHPRLCHHLHLPLQSGDDAVLAAMGRSYTSGDFARLIERIRAAWPEAAVSTDLLVGFPGETDAQFRRTVEFAQEMRFSRVHVFPFSRRPGTRAAELPDTPAAVKAARMEEMLAVADGLVHAYAESWVGRQVTVLFEQRDRAGWLTGLTEHYGRLRTRGSQELVGRIVTLVPNSTEGGELRA